MSLNVTWRKAHFPYSLIDSSIDCFLWRTFSQPSKAWRHLLRNLPLSLVLESDIYPRRSKGVKQRDFP